MKRDYIVTVWHFEDDNEVPVRKVFKNSCKKSVHKLSKNGIKQKGFYSGDSMDVRIFTDEDISIIPGDYLLEGECCDTYPDRGKSRKIIEVRDNRRGVNRHWRILCGG